MRRFLTMSKTPTVRIVQCDNPEPHPKHGWVSANEDIGCPGVSEHEHVWRHEPRIYVGGRSLYVCECGAQAVNDDEEPTTKALAPIKETTKITARFLDGDRG
jgi:hypothetical protein